MTDKPQPLKQDDQKRNNDLGTFGVLPIEPAKPPDYFPHDTPISDNDALPTSPETHAD